MSKTTILSLAIAMIAGAVCLADPPATAMKPVTLNITGNAIPITSALDMLAKQTSTTIVYDYTVKGTLGDSHISLPSLDAMFGFLIAKDKGLTVQSIYLPADKTVPTGLQLVGLVSALKQIQASGLVVVGKDDNSTITFSHGNAPAAAPAGMKLVYLVTNEATRTQLAADDAAQQRVAAAATQIQPGIGANTYRPATTTGVTTTDPNAAARQAYRDQMRAMRAAARAQMQQQKQQNQPITVGSGVVITPN